MLKLKLFAPLAMATALAGCATEPFSAPVPVEILAAPACPHTRQYTDAELCAMADAIDALPAASPLREMADDYSLLRDESRICRGEPKPEPRTLECPETAAPLASAGTP